MLRYLSLFSGIGAFEKALTNLGANYEVVNYCEIDKYASKSYSAIHGVPESKNLWDITKVNVCNLPTNIQLYKQAGNSIVVDVLEEIFRMMLDDEDNLLV